MRFTKMHGIGNDYIYVNGFAEHVADPSSLARRISDRHRGVGADGLILILPPDPDSPAHIRMRMFNADGSESEMCGNGIRCLAKYAHDHHLTDARPIRVQTGAGILPIDFTTDAAGLFDSATVDMGPPILEAARIPVRIPGVAPDQHIINLPFDPGVTLDDNRLTALSMGNPHAVFFTPDVATVSLASLGPVIERHPCFPNRINVHFVQVRSPAEVVMRTWERGSGITLACGTGACAVAVAGVLTQRTQRQLLTHLPGGDLQLHWRESDNHVHMTGPAVEVFTGDWPDESLPNRERKRASRLSRDSTSRR